MNKRLHLKAFLESVKELEDFDQIKWVFKDHSGFVTAFQRNVLESLNREGVIKILFESKDHQSITFEICDSIDDYLKKTFQQKKPDIIAYDSDKRILTIDNKTILVPLNSLRHRLIECVFCQTGDETLETYECERIDPYLINTGLSLEDVDVSKANKAVRDCMNDFNTIVEQETGLHDFLINDPDKSTIKINRDLLR